MELGQEVWLDLGGHTVKCEVIEIVKRVSGNRYGLEVIGTMGVPGGPIHFFGVHERHLHAA